MLNRNSRFSDEAVAVLATLIAVSLAACGGTALSTTAPSAGFADATTPTVILNSTLDHVEAGGKRVLDFNVPRTSTLALRVYWTDSTNSVVAVLTGAGCPAFYGAAADCQVRRTVNRQGKEGREGFIDYAGAGGAYRLELENEGPGVETIRVTVAVSSLGPPVTPTPYPTNRPTPHG